MRGSLSENQRRTIEGVWGLSFESHCLRGVGIKARGGVRWRKKTRDGCVTRNKSRWKCVHRSKHRFGKKTSTDTGPRLFSLLGEREEDGFRFMRKTLHNLGSIYSTYTTNNPNRYLRFRCLDLGPSAGWPQISIVREDDIHRVSHLLTGRWFRVHLARVGVRLSGRCSPLKSSSEHQVQDNHHHLPDVEQDGFALRRGSQKSAS